MATRIEFHQHGGPDVLQALEFTPKDPAEHEIQVASTRPRHCRAVWVPKPLA